MLRSHAGHTIGITLLAACAILMSRGGLMAQTISSGDLSAARGPEFSLAQLAEAADETPPPVRADVAPPEADSEPPVTPETPEVPDAETPLSSLRTPLDSSMSTLR